MSIVLHPIVQQMAPSPEQIPAIVARGRGVVVTAGAGSGKTRTLVARYLALLSEGDPGDAQPGA
jgi:ATP-dependent exoDNAse (exonuclease V) beta subunit